MTNRQLIYGLEERDSPHHFDALSSAQHFVHFPLRQRVFGALSLGFSLLRVIELLLTRLGLLRLLLLPLLLQLELKVLQVSIGSLVCWVWRWWRHFILLFCARGNTETI